MEKINLDDRVEKAVSLFKSGYNCSQSVFLAFSDLYGIDEDIAKRISSSFGGGIGRMRETCGAACGLFMLAGLYNGYTDSNDKISKNENYKLVQELAQMFREANGSIKCSDLLGTQKEKTITHISEDRTPDYYVKRPCPEIVRSAATIWANFLHKNNFILQKRSQDIIL